MCPRLPPFHLFHIYIEFFIVFLSDPSEPLISTPDGRNVKWEMFNRENLNYLNFANRNNDSVGVELKKDRLQKNNAFWLEYLNWIIYDRTPPGGKDYVFNTNVPMKREIIRIKSS